jgi:hypothetical protein
VIETILALINIGVNKLLVIINYGIDYVVVYDIVVGMMKFVR